MNRAASNGKKRHSMRVKTQSDLECRHARGSKTTQSGPWTSQGFANSAINCPQVHSCLVRLLAYGKRHQRWPVVDLLDLDELLASHIEEMWNKGEPKSWSSDLVAGVQHFMPSAKGGVPIAWSLIQAWNRRELPCRALPLTPELVAGMAGGFLVAGYPRLAAGLLVGFDTLARTGELLSLVVDDVMVDGRAGFAGVLRFRETKTGQREGVHQSVAIENAVVRGALRYLCREIEPGEQLLQITDFKFRLVWAHVVTSLQLQEFSLRPYSM